VVSQEALEGEVERLSSLLARVRVDARQSVQVGASLLGREPGAPPSLRASLRGDSDVTAVAPPRSSEDQPGEPSGLQDATRWVFSRERGSIGARGESGVQRDGGTSSVGRLGTGVPSPSYVGIVGEHASGTPPRRSQVLAERIRQLQV